MLGGKIEYAKSKIEFSIVTTILIGLPCTAIMYIFAGPILDILFPNASSGESMLALSSLSIIFVVLMQTINGALQGLGKTIIPVIALSIGVVIKLVLNIVLMSIEKIGINGAIISSVISQSVSMTICFVCLFKDYKMNFKIGKLLIKPIIATFGMTLCSKGIYNFLITSYLFNIKVSFILSCLIGLVIYLLLVMILRNFNKEEILMFPYGEKAYKILRKLKIYN